MGVREPALGRGPTEDGALHLWNSCVPSSPSVWIIRQCLRIAASLLNWAASSFRQRRAAHLDLGPRQFIYKDNCFKAVATSPKANILFFFFLHQAK